MNYKKAPERMSATPINFPSKFGFPLSIAIPKKAIINPIMFLSGTFSPSKKYAIKIPNGISAWTKRVADAPSSIFNP